MTIIYYQFLLSGPFFQVPSFLCVKLFQNITKCLLCINIHILVLILQSTYFICTTWKCKQSMKRRHYACERTKPKQIWNQVTSHSNWSRVLLLNLSHKQCSGIIKGWLHCPTSESKGRLLINNILFDSEWSLVMGQTQFYLIRKDEDWMSRTLADPPPPYVR